MLGFLFFAQGYRRKGISTKKNIEYDTQNSIFFVRKQFFPFFSLSIDNLPSIDCSHRHSSFFMLPVVYKFFKDKFQRKSIFILRETLISCSSCYRTKQMADWLKVWRTLCGLRHTIPLETVESTSNGFYFINSSVFIVWYINRFPILLVLTDARKIFLHSIKQIKNEEARRRLFT